VESGACQFVALSLGMAISAGILAPILLRLRTSVGEAGAQWMAAALEEDLKFLMQSLEEYPRLAREFYRGLTERRIPGTPLTIVQRSLDPKQVAVLVSREKGHGDKARAPRFVVDAAYPDGVVVKVGTEIPLDTGEIGFAAESPIVVSHQHLREETPKSRIKPGPTLAAMPQPDLIAPLVLDQETLGIIAVARPRKSGDPKAALRLVAQTGAPAAPGKAREAGRP
jgi:hypothetical protein